MVTLTAVPVINRMTATLGGTPTATTVVEALLELEAVIGSGIVDPEAIATAVDAYFEEHPEAMLQDGSVTGPKFAVPYWGWATDEDGDTRLAIIENE